MARPNILYIHSHDTGRFIQPYGHGARTPHLQRLAEQGVLFGKAFSAAPSCSPSRACLLTGQWAHSNGMLGLAGQGNRLNDYKHHIIHTLHQAGYTSALAGLQHVARPPYAQPAQIGYHRMLTDDHRQASESAVEFLSAAPAQPFFLSVGFGQTHRPYPPPSAAYDPRYTLPPPPLPDTPVTRADMAGFNTSATELDENIGAVMRALDDSALADNTLVIATTDHGIAFPMMKSNLTDHGIGVYLIMRGPRAFTGGKVIDALVSQVDIFPTVCDLLGVVRPNWLQGESMLPLVDGTADQIRDAIYAEINYQGGTGTPGTHQPTRAVRTDRWKYIRRFEPDDALPMGHCDESPCKDLWMENGWPDQPRNREMLFDLMFDPNETNNLADQPHAGQALAAMRDRLRKWMADTQDVL